MLCNDICDFYFPRSFLSLTLMMSFSYVDSHKKKDCQLRFIPCVTVAATDDVQNPITITRRTPKNGTFNLSKLSC